jgi:hypothetical protein
VEKISAGLNDAALKEAFLGSAAVQALHAGSWQR